MKHVINVRKIALEIVQVLHQNEVPIASIQFVFQEAERLASIKTVPYSPSKPTKYRRLLLVIRRTTGQYPMVEDFFFVFPKTVSFRTWSR